MMQRFVLAITFISLVTSLTFPLKRVEVTTEQKAALSANTKRQNIPLYGGITTVALFYAQIEIGTPGQSLNVQVDTGSSDLLVFGSQCQSCGSGATYNYQSSSSYAVVPCQTPGFTCATCVQFNGDDACSFSDYYGDGSGVNGSVLTDMLTVGPYSNIKVAFGNIQSSTQNFEPAPVDGIWGVSYPDLAITSPAIFDLFKQANIYQGYGLCLGSNPSMTLGKPSVSYQFTPVVQVEYFNVQMNDFQVNGVSINQTTYGQTIVDSGTTLLLIPTAAYNALYAALLSLCSSGSNLPGICNLSQGNSLFGGNCFSIPNLNAFPTFTIVLNPGINLNVPPSAYLLQQNNGYCLGIQAAGTQTILGDVFMQNFNVFFDIQNQQVGFAPANTC